MRILLTFFSLLVCCMQATSQQLSDAAKKTVRSEVIQTLSNYSRDISNEGMAAEFSYLDSSADFFWVPPGYSSALSFDSVASILRINQKNYRKINNVFDTVSVIPLTASLAAYTARIRSSMTDQKGTLTRMMLIETGLLVKRKDGWKLLNGQTSLLSELPN